MRFKQKIRTSSFSVVISMFLVLFVFGILVFLLINNNLLINHIKQNIGFSVMIKQNAKETEILQLQKWLEAQPYVMRANWVSKEEAAAELQKDLGEDFIAFLGYNPLLETLDITLHADFAHPDSMLVLQKRLATNDLVHEVFYPKDLVEQISKNTKKLSMILMSFCILLFVISFTLIHHTIRLSVYSKRFLIRTMKLVGATNRFIKKPFLINSVYTGIYSALAAICVLLLLLQMLQKDLSDFLQSINLNIIVIIMVCILVAGILLSWVSTYLALNKYLKIKESEIYH